jgi:hypothetical protein
MKKEIDYKNIAKDLITVLEYEYSAYRICYELIALGYSDDELTLLGFDYDDIETASRDVMLGVDPT